MKKCLFTAACLVALIGCSRSDTDGMGTPATTETTTIQETTIVTNEVPAPLESTTINTETTVIEPAPAPESTTIITPPPAQPDVDISIESTPPQPQQPDQSNQDQQQQQQQPQPENTTPYTP